VVEGLDGADVQGYEDRLAAGLLDGLPWFGELDLLDALVGDQEGDALPG
jgi:hypothetical protein